ncbi:CocE/NonD family hydrolase C-terminal non-catalytic domain-containing protein [Eisenbergiella porci]|uniref:CocE/NonD family hydrolase C-terminal non-catalytic domain-containing protein n=1 Tax=Eisenbergiella porci TaxID=2652274 RepID=UPI003FA409F6
MRNGITTLAYRNQTDNPLSYNGEVVKIIIKCWDIAWRLKEGSRLRIDISSSNFPEFSIHPNTSTVWSMEANPCVAHQKVLFGKKYPSKIVLPIDEK